jgi:hypothetical protein
LAGYTRSLVRGHLGGSRVSVSPEAPWDHRGPQSSHHAARGTPQHRGQPRPREPGASARHGCRCGSCASWPRSRRDGATCRACCRTGEGCLEPKVCIHVKSIDPALQPWPPMSVLPRGPQPQITRPSHCPGLLPRRTATRPSPSPATRQEPPSTSHPSPGPCSAPRRSAPAPSLPTACLPSSSAPS